MKRALLILALVAPSLFLGFLSLQPQADARASLPLFHFYIVTFVTFAAAVISILLSSMLESIAQPRHVLAAVAFAVIASIFFVHGFATRGALIDYPHPAVRWSAWLTLFGGGLIFALAGLYGPVRAPRWLSLHQIIYVTVTGIILYLGVVIFAPHWLNFIDANTEAWQLIIFLLSLGLWLFAAICLWQTWRITRNRVDGALAFVAFWLAHAVVSMHRFPVWQLSWWLYHFLLCASFLITVYILAAEYEQARQFRLLRYYLGISLICTILLALLASYLFAEFSYRTLAAQIQSSTVTLVNSLTQEIATTTPTGLTPADRQARYAARLSEQSLDNISLYDSNGQIFYPAAAGELPLNPAKFEQALHGETLVEIRPPGEATNNPFSGVYVVETYAPLPAAQPLSTTTEPPIGVLVALQAAPELAQAVLRARAAGLAISALTMGLLFVTLLAVVGRADRIMRGRTQELIQAYTNLRQAEQIRDDLSNMVLHDLRNPLNIISATFDLLRQTSGETRLKIFDRFWDSVYRAAQRMTGLVDDILAVSKIEAGQLEPHFVATPLAQLLIDRLNGFKPLAEAENKQLSLDCPPDLTAQLDPALIGRVVENLVGNAFKYTGKDGLIQVTACAENNCVRLSVRDNGDGIPDDYKQQIFEKFSQAPTANGRPLRKGAGLGLAFCSLVVQAHGGRIWVTDAPGGGSEFVVVLPQQQEAV
jgi:signal transduction histidine kinase